MYTLGPARKTRRRKEAADSVVCVYIAMHCIPIQRKAADRHDQATTKNYQATVGNYSRAISGKTT